MIDFKINSMWMMRLKGVQKSEPPSPHHTLTQKFLGELISRSGDKSLLVSIDFAPFHEPT